MLKQGGDGSKPQEFSSSLNSIQQFVISQTESALLENSFKQIKWWENIRLWKKSVWVLFLDCWINCHLYGFWWKHSCTDCSIPVPWKQLQCVFKFVSQDMNKCSHCNLCPSMEDLAILIDSESACAVVALIQYLALGAFPLADDFAVIISSILSKNTLWRAIPSRPRTRWPN